MSRWWGKGLFTGGGKSSSDLDGRAPDTTSKSPWRPWDRFFAKDDNLSTRHPETQLSSSSSTSSKLKDRILSLSSSARSTLGKVADGPTRTAQAFQDASKVTAKRIAAVPSQAVQKLQSVSQETTNRFVTTPIKQARNFILLLAVSVAFGYGFGSALPQAFSDWSRKSKERTSSSSSSPSS